MEKLKVKVPCELCGSQISASNMTRHKKSGACIKCTTMNKIKPNPKTELEIIKEKVELLEARLSRFADDSETIDPYESDISDISYYDSDII